MFVLFLTFYSSSESDWYRSITGRPPILTRRFACRVFPPISNWSKGKTNRINRLSRQAKEVDVNPYDIRLTTKPLVFKRNKK